MSKFDELFLSALARLTQTKAVKKTRNVLESAKQAYSSIGQAIESKIPGGWEGAKQRIKADPWGPTPAGFYQEGPESAGRFLNQLTGGRSDNPEQFTRGLLDPFGVFHAASNKVRPQGAYLTQPETDTSRKYRRAGQTASGLAMTYPFGGFGGIASRGIQGTLLGGGIQAGKNVLTGQPILKDIKQGGLTGLENSWKLAFTNLASDKIAAKYLPQLHSTALGSQPTLWGNLQNVFFRALLESPVENTFFTALNKFNDDEKRSFVKAWVQNLPGEVAGNLLFSTLQSGKLVWDDPKVRSGAIKAFNKTVEAAKDESGFIDLSEFTPKTSGDKAVVDYIKKTEIDQDFLKGKADLAKQTRDLFTTDQLKNIAKLKNLMSFGKYSEGDVETLRAGKHGPMVEKIIESIREVRPDIVGDSEALDFALKVPTLAQAKVKRPENLDELKEYIRGQQSTSKVQEILGRNRAKLRTAPGQYTNVPEIDNPLLRPDARMMKDYNLTPGQLERSTRNAKAMGMTPREHLGLLDYVEQANNPNVLKNKASATDLLRTPKSVFKKLKMEKEFDLLDKQWLAYKQELPKELKKIEAWEKQESNLDSAKNIFRYLDGKKVNLDPSEEKVANEIKDYLKQWADRLDLDPDSRISNYITHIFKKGTIEKEFDPDLAKLIKGKIPGSVYNPFQETRAGKTEYIENVWMALNAYVKRATRKVNIDPALEKIKNISETLPIESQTYIEKYLSNVNMRPSDIDTWIGNAIKQSPVGYKLGPRPMANIAPKIRNTIYRGAIGLNPGSAVKNLSQISNTYAELGERYTLSGVVDTFKLGLDNPELVKSGVFEDSFIKDKNLAGTKKVMKKVDSVLFYLFDRTEKINRATAYYGAKRKALNQGMSEKKAMNEARKLVEKTQFKFGAIHTPVALSAGGDFSSLFTQFKTFGLKQLEFLTEKVAAREWAGIIRYIAATILLTKTVGKFLGWDLKDQLFPDPTGASPIVQIAQNVPRAFSEDAQTKTKAIKDLKRSGFLAIPGGGQIRKSTEGYKAYKRGYSETPSGRIRFPVKQSAVSAFQNIAFGQWAPEYAKQYIEGGFKSLGSGQSEIFKLHQENGTEQEYFEYVSNQREIDSDIEAVVDYLKTDPDKYDLNIDSQLAAEAILRYILSLDSSMKDKAFKKLAVSDEIKKQVILKNEQARQGLTIEDREILEMPPAVRIVAIYNRIMKLVPKNRQKKYQQLLRLGVITPEMIPLLKKMVEK